MIVKCYNCFKDYDDEHESCPHCRFSPSSDKREANHLPIGTKLAGRYIVGRVCGFGGFGVTYKAFDTQLDTIVAIKEYFPNGTVNRVPGTENVVMFNGNRLKEFNYGLSRFLDEARTTAKYVSHKNIVNVFDFFEANKTAYIVMEFLDGITLEKFLETSTGGTEKLDIDQAVEITLDICNALKAIHSDGIIHRDVAPDNIYLCFNGSTKLFDFGAARFSADKDKLLTVILKPGYAPVEQYVEEDSQVNNQGPWTDVYALGATLYKLVTGVKPIESMNRKINDELQEPIELDPTIPEYLNNAIMRAMAIERHLRFQSIEEFESVLSSKTKIKSVKETIKRKKRIRLAGICGAAAVVLCGAGIFVHSWNKDKEENTLPPAKIEVWYMSDNDAMTKALTDITEVFCKNYEGVKVELVGVSSGEYEEKLRLAYESGNAPELFQSDLVDTSKIKVESLKSVYDKLELNDYYFLKNGKSEILAQNKLPLGFNIPMFYINSTMLSFAGSSMWDVEALGAVAVKDGLQDELEAHIENVTETVSVESFYNGESNLLFGDTSMYFDVRDALPGQYQMILIEGSGIRGYYENCWSMSSSGKDEEKVAQRFLEFLLSDNSQDYFYIRNTNKALPLNKRALEVYKDVYEQDVENILVGFDAYKIEMK